MFVDHTFKQNIEIHRHRRAYIKYANVDREQTENLRKENNEHIDNEPHA